ncbi:uncharacterized protein LOC104453783 [Eucalyptus grandis]|uniref:uncharacterized protein LOC104453783 n=1 Tax=Eucalyptus grandis TaxID=71139 RepID=UPI00192EC229|nr:uncharacterized protein LOC104453783 [Eucalyptus grandis]
MVSARLKERESARGGSAAMGSSDRPKQLHNFSLPCLRWSNQKHLRCVKVGSPSPSPSPSVPDDGGRSGGGGGGGVGVRSLKFAIRRIEEGTEEAREVDRPMAVVFGPQNGGGGSGANVDGDRDDGMGGRREKRRAGDELWGEREEDSGVPAENKEGPEQEPGAVAAAQAAVPWNLRTRRPGFKVLAALNIGAKYGDSPSRSEGVDVGGSGGGAGGSNGGKNEEREKFAVPLKRKEIEKDFLEMTGHRPSRRPKKRNRTVQKNLDAVFPGLWLTEVTADAYKVEEVPEYPKR